MDMLHGSLFDKILLFALPLAAGSMLQQMFNAVDVAVIGRFGSSRALAAVGSNSAVVMLFVTLFVGTSAGTSVVIANYIGEGRKDRISAAVHTSMFLALVGGLGLMASVLLLAHPILMLMAIPEEVLPLSIIYLRVYSLGMPGIMVYNFGAAVLRSVGDSRRPVRCLILSGVINAVLNVIFVVAFGWGVAGVALATSIANTISAGLVVYFLMTEETDIRFDPKKLRLHRYEAGRILMIGVPTGLQGTVFSVANVCVQTAVNGYGAAAIAGCSICQNFEGICFYSINGFAQAATTFAGQNFGARNMRRCLRVLLLCMGAGVAACMFMNVLIVSAGHPIAGLFTKDPEVIKYAVERMRYILLFQWLACSYEITGACMRGFGDSLSPTILTVFGTCLLRIIWILTVDRKFHIFRLLLIVYPVSWILTGILVITAFTVLYRRLARRYAASA